MSFQSNVVTKRECPESYVEHSNACYYFGPYSSYEAAKQSCKLEEAKLVEVTPFNNKYIKDTVQSFGSNDHWIGSYIVRGKTVKKKSGRCPMFRGQAGPKGDAFTQVSCNSAYPYICQKYGENKQNGQLPGLNSFNLDSGEFEFPFSKSQPETTTTAAKEAESNRGVIATVVCIIALILFVVLLRWMCNRRAANKQKKLQQQQMRQEKAKLQKQNNLATNSISSINKPSRSNTLRKTFTLPQFSSEEMSRSMTRQSSFENNAFQSEFNQGSLQPPTLQPPTESYDSKRRSRRRTRKSFRHYQRSLSGEIHPHDYHSASPPPSPYEQHYKRRSLRSEMGRRRSMGSMLDAKIIDYSGYSRNSSPDSNFSDSAFSTSSGTSYRNHRVRSHRKKSIASIRHFTEDGYHGSSHERKRSHRRRSRHGRRSRFEQYAEGRPPSPALDILERHVNSEQFREQQTYLRGRDPYRGGNEMTREFPRRNAETLKPIYFPQMTTAWSEDDLKVVNDSGFQQSPKQVRPIYPRAYPKGPIRVNRHIHDRHMSGASASTTPKTHSDDSDHIYESLDDVKPTGGHLHRAIPLQSARSFARSSLRSRASMRSRELPALPPF